MSAQPFAGPIFWPDILTALAGRQAWPKRWTTRLKLRRMMGGLGPYRCPDLDSTPGINRYHLESYSKRLNAGHRKWKTLTFWSKKRYVERKKTFEKSWKWMDRPQTPAKPKLKYMKFRDKDGRRIPRHEYQKELQNTLLRNSGKVDPKDCCRLETTQHVWRKVSFQSTTRNSPWNATVQTVLRRKHCTNSQSSILWTAGSCWVSRISGSQE